MTNSAMNSMMFAPGDHVIRGSSVYFNLKAQLVELWVWVV